MKYFLEIGLCIISAFALIPGMRRYTVLDSGSRIVLLIVAAGLFFALPSVSLSYNSYVFVNTCIALHFLLVCIYFNHTIDVFIRSGTGLKIGVAGLLAGTGTAGMAPGLYISLAESLCAIAMCLWALYRLLLQHEQLRLLRYPHFWFITIFLFYWSVTYFINSFFTYDLLSPAGPTLSAGQSMKLISLFTYAGAGCIFLFYKKKFTVHE
jgi:hypothetical protein